MTSPATCRADTQPGRDVSRTQDAILAAYAALIEELATDDVSFRRIARRAGVSERTVFRNYPTRVDLLVAAAAWIESRFFARQDSASIFDIPLAIRATMESYGRRPTLTHVVAEGTMRDDLGAAFDPRRALLEEMVDTEILPIAAAERVAIVAALAHLDSAATWVTFRREFGMSSHDIADAAAWAAEAVLDPIRCRVALPRQHG